MEWAGWGGEGRDSWSRESGVSKGGVGLTGGWVGGLSGLDQLESWLL